MRRYVRPAGAPPIGLRYADDRAQDKNPGGRRRSAPARPAAALSDRAGVRRAHRSRCSGHGQAARARARRSARARPDAPGRGRPVDLPAAARREEFGPHHHADREGRGRGPHRRPGDGRRRLPAQALQPARAGRAHQRSVAPPRGAAPSGSARGRAGKGQLREHDGQPRDTHARARRPVDVAHHGRIRAAQGPGHEPEDAAVARQTDGARARPRIRSVRPLDRRPDLAPPQARREGSRASRLHPDRVGVRLRLRARRPAAIMSAMVLWPRSLLWRTFILLAALVLSTTAAWFEIFRASEIEPRARQISQNLVSIVNITRTALVNSQPELRRELLSELAEREGIQVYTAELGERLAPPADRPVLNLALELARQQLGQGTRFAGERDGKPGLWLSFHIDDDEYWLRIPRERIERQIALRWLGWGALALVLSLLAAYLLVSRRNLPLRALAEGAGAIGKASATDFSRVPELPLQALSMRRVVQNLIDNALRYGEKEVSVAVRAENGAAVLEVADRGPGIPDSEAERLKQPFTRLEVARSDKGGAGLGLAIVERVVRAHRGSFDLLAREGGGLVARIRLPG